MRTINCDSCGVEIETRMPHGPITAKVHQFSPVERMENLDLCTVCGGKLMDKLASGQLLNLFPGAAIDPVKEGERPGL